MFASVLILLPVLAAVAMLPIRDNQRLCKQLALGATLANLALSLVLWGEFDGNSAQYQNLQVLSYLSLWQINLGVDGLSLIFVFLTCFIMPCCILASWNSAPLTSKRSCRDLAQSGGDQGIKAELRFLLALLLVESLLIALFLVVDLLLFYICYESVLIPLFLMIGLWGSGQQKVRAAFMLFLYTLFGSLFMLVSFITIYLASGSTDILILSHMSIEPSAQRLLWLGIFLALAIKTPLLPLHIWLPLAHTEAPLAGSILLAALVLKMPIYAFLRILLPILPDGSHYFTPLVYTLCVISIVYSCFSTLRQINLKSIVAYSSIGHLAICVLGVFSNSVQGIEGAIYLGLGHGLVSPALFICVGILYDRYHSLIIHYYRGVAAMKPVFAVLFFIFILANMAAPLTANFIGEFLCFLGSFHRNPAATLLATSSVVLVASYSIWFYNRVCFGSFSPYLKPLSDLNRREFYVLLPILVLTILLGIISNIVLDCLHVPVSNLLYDTSLIENTPPAPLVSWEPIRAMLLLSILLFTAAMPFSTLLMSSLVIIRVAILVILLCSLLAFNSYFIEPLGVGVGIYGGLSLLSVISHGLTTLILASACLFMLVASGSLSHELCSNLSNPLAPYYPFSIRTPGAPLPELPLIILITTLGMTTLVTSSDLLTVYLSVELQTLPVYILACLNRESEAATSAGLKYFLIGALSSSFILLGSSLIYGLSGVTSLEGLYLLNSMGEGFTALVIPEVIIGIALLIKLGAAPFHFWPPDVYDGVPTLVTTWVAIMPKLGILGFLALFQGFSLIRGDLVTGYTYWGLILVASALLSLVIAPLLALAQYRIKRLVAYSSISHMGFMLLALALQSPQALEAFLFYLIQYVVTSFNLFFVLIAFPFQLSSSSLRGILPAPALRLSFAVTLFSMAGIPPLIGFFAKLLVVMAALDSGFLFLALVAILVSVITAGLYLRVIRVLLFVEGNPLGRSRGDTVAARDPSASLTLGPSLPLLSPAAHSASEANPLISMLIATLTLIIILFLANPYASLNSLHLIALCYYYW